MCFDLNSVVDAWGKIPSGILDGNLIELGSFSECFHIERNNEPYKSKYCTAKLSFDLKGMPASRSDQSSMNNVFIPNLLQMNAGLKIGPRGPDSMYVSFDILADLIIFS